MEWRSGKRGWERWLWIWAFTLTIGTGLGFTSTVIAQPVVMVLGDSLSAGYGLAQGTGWVDLLRTQMARDGLEFKVVNASISGETTLGGRNRLAKLLTTWKPVIVVVELGANDGLRGTDLATTRANLDAILEAATNAGAAALVIGMRLPPNYGADYGRRFHALFGEVAKTHKAGYVPFLLDGFAEQRGQFQDDGVHPRAEAQPAMLATVYRELKPMLERLRKKTAG